MGAKRVQRRAFNTITIMWWSLNAWSITTMMRAKQFLRELSHEICSCTFTLMQNSKAVYKVNQKSKSLTKKKFKRQPCVKIILIVLGCTSWRKPEVLNVCAIAPGWAWRASRWAL